MRTVAAAKITNTLLVRRPLPKDGESIRGYASRVDYENTVRLFTPRLGNLEKACASLRDLEAATGRKLDILCNGVFLNVVDRINVTSECFLAYRLPSPWVSAKHKRICPCCLREQGFMQGIWEIHVIDSCIVHGCSLLCRCNICDDLLDWTGGSLMTCRCGAPLCDMETMSVGPMRGSLDKLLVDRLHSDAKDKVDPFTSAPQHLFPPLLDQSFAAIAVIAFHIAPQIAYAIKLRNVADKKEQQADLVLRLIELGSPGIKAALFGVLGSEMQSLTPTDRAWLLCQDANSREMYFSERFNLDRSIHSLQVVRHVLFPAWDDAHRKWLATVDQSLIEYIAKCDPRLTKRHGLAARRGKFQTWSIWRDPKKIRLIVRLGKRLLELESRNENC